MESLLVGVTVVSLGLAVAMSFVAWTLLKAERQRAAARIEALEALAFNGEPARSAPTPPDKAVRTHESSAPKAESAPPSPPRLAVKEEPSLEMADWDAVIHEPVGQPDPAHTVAAPGARRHVVLPDAMFGTEAASTAGTRRLLAVAAMGLLVAAAYATASAMRSPEPLASFVPPAIVPDAEPQPLELLSLRHSIDADGSFTVSGFVQNPASGKNLTNVEAVIYLFDSRDQYFTTGRAPLETASMRTGTDSGFEVHIPRVTNVGRYRVGFRQADGTVVAHVDRRGHVPEGSSETVVGPDVIRPAGGMR